MSSASLAIARQSRRHQAHSHRAHPDAVRIAAISAALALNLTVLLIATRPMGARPLPAVAPPDPAQILRWITPPATVVPPPPIVMKPLPHPHKTIAPTRPRTVSVVPPPVTTTTGTITAPPATVPTTNATLAPSTGVPESPANAAPVEASLAYRSAPLQFPLQAMRQQMQGTVTLRVLVDETGKPISVVVEHSSGHALLDRSASEQVLASWRFQPAIVDGKAVRAWANVPVSFNLRGQ
jgi:protein TonB